VVSTQLSGPGGSRYVVLSILHWIVPLPAAGRAWLVSMFIGLPPRIPRIPRVTVPGGTRSAQSIRGRERIRSDHPDPAGQGHRVAGIFGKYIRIAIGIARNGRDGVGCVQRSPGETGTRKLPGGVDLAYRDDAVFQGLGVAQPLPVLCVYLCRHSCSFQIDGTHAL